MTRPAIFSQPYPQGVGIPGGDPALPPGQPPVDCCDDPAEMPDRALDSAVEIGVVSGDASLVQSTASTFNGGGGTLAYPMDTTEGNLLVAVGIARAAAVDDPTGWTAVDADVYASTNRVGNMWWRIAPGGAYSVPADFTTAERRLAIMEFAIGGSSLVDVVSLTNQSAANSFPVSPLVLAEAEGVLVGMVVGQHDAPGSIVFVTDSDYTLVDSGQVAGSNLAPYQNVAYRSHPTATTHDFTPTGTTSGGAATIPWGGILAAFDISSGWIGGGLETVDGDDATFKEIDGPNILRVWLGEAFGIARIRLVVGTETSGAKTYTLKGANLPDYSDAVTVATLNFTATGSFTPDTVTDSWEVTDEYEYWELTGPDALRRIFTFELYEASNITPGDLAAIEADIADLQDDVAQLQTDVDAVEAEVDVLQGIDYLVGTASGALTSEIVVGTTPGGELGNTWASPTVDTTHSGSAHSDFIAKAIVDAKGDIIAATAADTVARVAVGTDGQVLTASSGATAGVTWSNPATSGIGPLLIDSGHSVPIVFGDILQASDGSDFLYASAP